MRRALEALAHAWDNEITYCGGPAKCDACAQQASDAEELRTVLASTARRVPPNPGVYSKKTNKRPPPQPGDEPA